MGCCRISLALFVVLLSIVGYLVHQSLYSVPSIPLIPRDQWWGSQSPDKLDTSIRPFKVQFKQDKLLRLKERLNDTNWYTEPLEGVGFEYGINSKYLKRVVDFWKNEYNFAERQKAMNRFPQFVTNIQGLDINYIHVTQPNPKNLKIVPILMIYAWPINIHKLIEKVFTNNKDNNEFVLTIIAPTLPGFGYSQGTTKPGLGVAQMAVMMDNLMERLGHKKYYAQGGDWGAEVGAILSTLYPEKILGLHTNLAQSSSPVSILKHILFSFYPSLHQDEDHIIARLYPLSQYFSNLIRESGHIHLQSTKPDTFGIILQDSPIGLAAHIIEKFSTWSNMEWSSLEDGGLEKHFSLTELLDNVMIYWDSGCITTSMRIYSETFNKPHMSLNLDRIPVTVPTAIARCGQDVLVFSKSQLAEKFHNILKIKDIKDGGHFVGFQQPDIIAEDIIDSVTMMQKLSHQ